MARASEIILIERGPLLNFWVAEIVLLHPHRPGSRAYKGVEWRFQAMKTTCLIGGTRERRGLHDRIATASDGFSAKRLGRDIAISVPLWDERSYGDMLEAQVAKFTQHDDLAEILLATGDAELIEHRPDPIWGDGMDGSGLNLQGRALKVVRAMLR